MNTPATPPPRRATATAQNARRLAIWTAAWVLSMAVATFGPKLLWDFAVTWSWLAILLNVAIGAGMILANKRHLQGLDELHQKVQLEAMAMALGVGIVAGLGYSNLDIANLIPGDAEIGILVIVVSLTYLVSMALGLRRYR